MNPDIMLQLNGVDVFRGNTHVLHEVSLEVGKSERRDHTCSQRTSHIAHGLPA